MNSPIPKQFIKIHDKDLVAYTIEKFAKENNLTVAFPGYIGCGIAGGDWTTVLDILDDVFSGSTVKCTIVYK